MDSNLSIIRGLGRVPFVIGIYYPG